MRPILVDTTLREGLQSPGLRLRLEDRLALACRLVRAGITELEIGAAASPADAESIREILRLGLPARMLTWNRARAEDLEASLALGAQSLFISAPVSDLHIEKKLGSTRAGVLENLSRSISAAKNAGCYVAAGLEDATRADPGFLDEMCQMLTSRGVDRIRLADTVGILTPERSRQLFAHVAALTQVPLESHTHNDFGLATANALEARLGGATYLDVTLLGVGERAGNAPLEELALALAYLVGDPAPLHLDQLNDLVEFFSAVTGIPIPSWKGGVGRYAFTHSSGLHVHGVAKDPSTYEAFNPADIGRSRLTLLGPHAGRSAAISKAEELGISLTDEEVAALLDHVRKVGHALPDEEILRIVTILREP